MTQFQRNRCSRIFTPLLCLGLCFVSVMSAGCSIGQTKVQGVSKPEVPRTMSVQQLALQLHMRVEKCGRYLADLSNSRNSVVIITDPRARVLVNGLLLEINEPIIATDSTIIVPASLEARIRQHLKPDNYTPPTTWNDEISRPQNNRQRAIVVLDPGHGGKDSGAISAAGSREKDVVLSVGRMVQQQLLRNNVRVIMTRSRDVFIPLDRRVDIANSSHCALFVSIHADAASNKRARGFTVYVPRREKNNSLSYRAGRFVVRSLKGFSRDRGVRKHPSKNLRVLEHTRCPAILIEMGYLSNRREAGRLETHQTQQRLADSIAGAILRYLQNQKVIGDGQ